MARTKMAAAGMSKAKEKQPKGFKPDGVCDLDTTSTKNIKSSESSGSNATKTSVVSYAAKAAGDGIHVGKVARGSSAKQGQLDKKPPKRLDLASPEHHNIDDRDPASCFCGAERGGKVISCETCHRWCHPSCVGISTVLYNMLSESEAPYLCPLCVLLRFTRNGSIVEQDDSGFVLNVKSEIDSLKERVCELKIGMMDIVEDMRDLPSVHSSAAILSDDDITVDKASAQLEAVSVGLKEQEKKVELHDRHVRRKNSVVFGLSEFEREDPSKAFAKCLEAKLKMNPEEVPRVVDAFRLGKQKDNSPRPLLVKLKDKLYKTIILKKCYLLKGSNIFISRDFTSLQRRNMRKLVARMKEAREDGYKDVFISHHGVLWVDGDSLGSVDALEFITFVNEEDLDMCCD